MFETVHNTSNQKTPTTELLEEKSLRLKKIEMH